MTFPEPSPHRPDDAATDTERFQYFCEWTQRACDPAFHLVQVVAVILVLLLTAAWACLVPSFG
jgi:lipopolysaccharide/colanic/teichoic acid biosynthesis glycosyltransferase